MALVAHEFTPPRTNEILVTHKRWPPWIKMIPQYSLQYIFQNNMAPSRDNFCYSSVLT
jgi:hypothetical protein